MHKKLTLLIYLALMKGHLVHLLSVTDLLTDLLSQSKLLGYKEPVRFPLDKLLQKSQDIFLKIAFPH